MAGRKTNEERVALIDQKIQKKKEEIAELEEQKNRLLHPVTMRAVMAKAKEIGMTPEVMAEKLGIEI